MFYTTIMKFNRLKKSKTHTMNFWMLSILTLLIGTCKPPQESHTFLVPHIVKDSTEIIVGAERLGKYLPLLQGKKIGVVCNQTSLIGSQHLVDSLLKMDVDIVSIFSPEHGIRGNADAGESVQSSIDPITKLPIISLYGDHKKPTKDDLADLDIIVFDIQDVGVRFYTYISTLHYVMEACAEQGKSIIVLDRPNPNGYFVDGPILDQSFTSFVGMHPIPVVYGMTIGEYARMINGENWLHQGMQADLTVIELKNYSHSTFYELPVRPSPNLPDIRAILLYPSTCFFEGTTLSLGRGTDKPFQYIGHPSMHSEFSFVPMPNFGSKHPPQEGKRCFGSDLSNVTLGSITDKKGLDLSLLLKYYTEINAQGETFFLKNNFFDKLAGSDALRKQIIEGKNEAEIRASWQPDLERFQKIRAKYLLYN